MIGIVFGCFIPLHEGHMFLIKRALDECDQVIIGVCGHADDRGKDFIPFKDRLKLMKKKFKDDPRVIVVPVDDKKIGLTGKFDIPSWKLWSDELFSQANIDPNGGMIFAWYMGEQSYADKLKKIFPKHHSFIVVERQLKLSGTKIRKQLYKYGQFVDDLFIKYLSKKNPFIIEYNFCDGSDLLDNIDDTLCSLYDNMDLGISWEAFVNMAKNQIVRHLDVLKKR